MAARRGVPERCRTPGSCLPATWATAVLVSLGLAGPRAAWGQIPEVGEVRQIVTLSFVPGRGEEGLAAFEELAVPLYERDPAMVTFRGFSEVESSIPLDLVVVSSFDGLAAMDDSNRFLGGEGIGAFYERIGPVLAHHTDQFVEMLPELGRGDPSFSPRTLLVWYRVGPGQGEAFESALRDVALPVEAATGVPSQTGRFLLGNGWHYLRFLGLPSLGGYEAYWRGLRAEADYARMADLIVATREVMLRGVEGLFVR